MQFIKLILDKALYSFTFTLYLVTSYSFVLRKSIIMHFSSTLLNDAVEAFSSLPGIGKKTALRLVLHLINQDVTITQDFAKSLLKMREEIKHCSKCHNISDSALCEICNDKKRDSGVVCLVQDIRDVIAIESTGQYYGQYHVLGGVISPIEGIGPADLNIDSLIRRIEEDRVKELIMAVSPTIEGETTIFYISKILKEKEVKVSTIARGVSFGGELQYADEVTLGRSIMSRTEYTG